MAQNTNNFFEIIPSEITIQNSLYDKLSVLDSRIDTTHFGIVQLGAFNRKTKVKVNAPIETQLIKIFNNQLGDNAKNGQLLFQIREFYFAEVTGAFSEKGYCYLKADLYNHNDSIYRKIANIDTVSVVSSMDVTKLLMRSSSNLITNFIAKNCTSQPIDNQIYTLTEIKKIDSLEKSKIKLYTEKTLTDGIYRDYISFKIQEPSIKEFKIDNNNQSIKVYTISVKEKKEMIKPKDIYAFVKDGNPYISTEYGYYPLTKRENNFYFKGKVKSSPNSSSVITASIFFGVVGAILASTSSETSSLKIDHQTGEFIRER